MEGKERYMRGIRKEGVREMYMRRIRKEGGRERYMGGIRKEGGRGEVHERDQVRRRYIFSNVLS